MSTRLLAAGTVFAALLTAPGLAIAGSTSQATSTDCLGLTCAAAGSENDVPGARAVAPSVGGPSDLEVQTTAGFYEYGRGTTFERRAVAYVVPLGQSDAMPTSVRDLPVVKAIRGESPSDFDRGAVVIFGPEASLFAAAPSAAKAARTQRIFGRTADIDAYQCSDNYFCLYSCVNWDLSYQPTCRKVQFGAYYTGTGWHRLGDFSFNDDTNSQRNRRDRDSLLAQHWPAGGTQYCAESHSSDSTLSNNAIGNRAASAFANVPDDIHC